MWFPGILHIGVDYAFTGLQNYIPLYQNLKKLHLHTHPFEKYEGKGQRKLIVG